MFLDWQGGYGTKWDDWMESGRRHGQKANVLLYDGTVAAMDPETISPPSVSSIQKQYWSPMRDELQKKIDSWIYDSDDDPTEVDSDSDGIANEEDNCPNTPNPSQTDSDGNDIGDACDSDSTRMTMEFPTTGMATGTRATTRAPMASRKTATTTARTNRIPIRPMRMERHRGLLRR